MPLLPSFRWSYGDWGHSSALSLALTAGCRRLCSTNSSLPKMLVVNLTVEILERGIGQVGRIHVASYGWQRYAPKPLGSIGVVQFTEIRQASKEACMKLKVVVRQRVMHSFTGTGLGPNGSLLTIL